jgi:hypothetical protein
MFKSNVIIAVSLLLNLNTMIMMLIVIKNQKHAIFVKKLFHLLNITPIMNFAAARLKNAINVVIS